MFWVGACVGARAARAFDAPEMERCESTRLHLRRSVWFYAELRDRQAALLAKALGMPSGKLAWEKQMPAVVARDRYCESDGLLAIWPDGSRVAFGLDDGSVLLLDLRTGVETGRMEPPATLRERVDVVTWSHDGSQILTGHRGGTLLFWDVAGRRPVRTLTVLDPKKLWDDQWRRSGFIDVLVNRELTLVLTLTHDGIVRVFGKGAPPRGGPEGGR